jgi:hypothetical protein
MASTASEMPQLATLRPIAFATPLLGIFIRSKPLDNVSNCPVTVSSACLDFSDSSGGGSVRSGLSIVRSMRTI